MHDFRKLMDPWALRPQRPQILEPEILFKQFLSLVALHPDLGLFLQTGHRWGGWGGVCGRC